ncbi:metal-dependent hydrolase [Pelomyxa schiedti]|nr:metal-dependent hydrolase [Pelomyxa schiedti]
MTSIQWLGHATFVVTCGTTKIYIDPWISTNPACPEQLRSLSLHHPDFILVSHGHGDHLGDTVEFLKQNRAAKAYVIHELSSLLQLAGAPEDQLVGMNKGGTVNLGPMRATMVHALHSSSTENEGQGIGSSPIHYAGEAAGWVVHTPQGVLYHSGDTDVFSDMEIINNIWGPKVSILCIGDHYTMGPVGAAYALTKYLTNTKIVIPMHFGTFPVLTGNPDQLRSLLPKTPASPEVKAMTPGETWSMS